VNNLTVQRRVRGNVVRLWRMKPESVGCEGCETCDQAFLIFTAFTGSQFQNLISRMKHRFLHLHSMCALDIQMAVVTAVKPVKFPTQREFPRTTAGAAILQRVIPSYQTLAGSTLPPSLRDVTTELPA